MIDDPSPRMKCPRDGTEMNYHADKLVEPASREEAERMDPKLGALIEEIFTCPRCGRVESRRST